MAGSFAGRPFTAVHDSRPVQRVLPSQPRPPCPCYVAILGGKCYSSCKGSRKNGHATVLAVLAGADKGVVRSAVQRRIGDGADKMLTALKLAGGAAGACRWLQLLIGTSRKTQADPAGGWGAGGFSRRRLGDRPAIPNQTGLTCVSDTLIWYALGNGALDLLQHQEHDCVPAAVGEGWCRGTARLQIRQATHMPQVMAFSQSRAG